MVTNRGAYLMALDFFRRGSTGITTGFKAMLFTSATAPTVDTNTVADLTEIAAGNGYTSGGSDVERSATGWDVITENDTYDRLEIQAKDLAWTASGGPIPASGSGARYLCITDDNATIASRQIILAFDLTSDRSVSDGQTLTVQNSEMRGSTV